MTPPLAITIWSDALDDLNSTAAALSPLVLLLVLGGAVPGALAANPGRRRRLLGSALLAGLAAGLLGYFVLESPRPYHDSLESLFRFPLLFSKWFILGFSAGWIGCTFALDRGHRPPAAIQVFLLFVGLAIGGVTFVGTVVVPQLYQREIDYWNRALDPAATSLDLTEARRHLSTKGRARIAKILSDRPNSIQSGVILGLQQLGLPMPARVRHIPPELMAEAIASIRQSRSPGRQEQLVMADLAKNSALDADTFALLSEKGDEKVLRMLIRHLGGDGERTQKLRAEVERRLAVEVSEPERRNWRNLLKSIDRAMLPTKSPNSAP